LRRINKFRLRLSEEQEKVLLSLCEMSVVLWNKVNYKRRQSFFRGEIDWDSKEEYGEFKHVIGSATAQQIIRKNNEAWRSFIKLLKLKRQGKLPKHIRKVSPPRYWKDRSTGRRRLITIIRNDCYRIEEVNGGKWLILPKGLRIRITGKVKWRGRQGRLEIHYDDLNGRWYAYQSVKVDQPRHIISHKKAFIDLGVINIITAWIEGERQAIAFSGRPLLADWWYWTRRIAKYQSKLKKVNGRNKSKRLRKLYRKRKLRFRDGVNMIIHRFVKFCYAKNVGEIIIGDITYIRDNNNKGSKVDSMIHNFWSFRYIINRLKTTAENFGIKVNLIEESYTSSYCPFCGTKGIRIKRGLFKCPKCNQVMNADVVGVLNIAKRCKAIIPSPKWDRDNGVLAHPLLRRLHEPEARIPLIN